MLNKNEAKIKIMLHKKRIDLKQRKKTVLFIYMFSSFIDSVDLSKFSLSKFDSNYFMAHLTTKPSHFFFRRSTIIPKRHKNGRLKIGDSHLGIFFWLLIIVQGIRRMNWCKKNYRKWSIWNSKSTLYREMHN